MNQMTQGMPEQCRAMMQNMPHSCMSMMQHMMHGRMGSATPSMEAQPPAQSAATKAYMEASERMHGPMMEGLQASDPDVAFVRGMIPHHQGAVDMAKVVLAFGKDPQIRKLAEEIVKAQESEIALMQDWLAKNAR
jgi:uncharacterized protein (DUF305 family)